VTLIVILSGVIGAAFSPLILRHINDERASGLALGLAAHAIGTAQAWQRVQWLVVMQLLAWPLMVYSQQSGCQPLYFLQNL
jgi:putative effector of murein hydrolase